MATSGKWKAETCCTSDSVITTHWLRHNFVLRFLTQQIAFFRCNFSISLRILCRTISRAQSFISYLYRNKLIVHFFHPLCSAQILSVAFFFVLCCTRQLMVVSFDFTQIFSPQAATVNCCHILLAVHFFGVCTVAKVTFLHGYSHRCSIVHLL